MLEDQGAFVLLLPPLILSVLGLIYSLFAYIYVKNLPREVPSTELRKSRAASELKHKVSSASNTFLVRQFIVVGIFGLIVVALAGVFVGWQSAVSVLLGCLVSSFEGVISMRTSTLAYFRCSVSTFHDNALDMRQIAFLSSTVIGISTPSLAVLSVTLLLIFFKGLDSPLNTPLDSNTLGINMLSGFGLGASIVSTVTRISGGIYVRASELSQADPFLSQYDGRNAGLIADLIGKNVGIVTGTAVDWLSSFSGAIITSLILGARTQQSPAGIVYPLWSGTAGILSSYIGLVCVPNRKPRRTIHGFRFALLVANLVNFLLLALITYVQNVHWSLFGCLAVGVATGSLLTLWFEYFNNECRLPIKTVKNAINFGSRIVLLEGLSNGMKATLGPAVLSGTAILLTRYMSGSVYGIALATLGALSAVSLHISYDMLNPIAINIKAFMGICRFSFARRSIASDFAKISQYVSSAGRGFVITGAALSATSLLFTFIEKANLDFQVTAKNDRLVVGTFFGACVPFVFTSLSLGSIARAAAAGITEIIRQLSYEAVYMSAVAPDYNVCIRLVQMISLYSMVTPALIPFMSPFIVGIGLGPVMLAGFLLGMIGSGYLLGIFLTMSGASWECGEATLSPSSPSSSPLPASRLSLQQQQQQQQQQRVQPQKDQAHRRPQDKEVKQEQQRVRSSSTAMNIEGMLRWSEAQEKERCNRQRQRRRHRRKARISPMLSTTAGAKNEDENKDDLEQGLGDDITGYDSESEWSCSSTDDGSFVNDSSFARMFAELHMQRRGLRRTRRKRRRDEEKDHDQLSPSPSPSVSRGEGSGGTPPFPHPPRQTGLAEEARSHGTHPHGLPPRHRRHIGNPFKDVTGPTLNILFKSACYVAVVFAEPITAGSEEQWWISLVLVALSAAFLWGWKAMEPEAMSHILDGGFSGLNLGVSPSTGTPAPRQS